MVYLHKELEQNQDFKRERWKRISIEVNKDNRTIRLEPECITFQETYGALLKSYNHGQQLRNEVVDRTPASMKDSLLTLLNYSDNGAGKTALKRVTDLEKKVDSMKGYTKLALNLSRKALDGQRATDKKASSKPPLFTKGSEVKRDTISQEHQS